jgi:hypothetical protein
VKTGSNNDKSVTITQCTALQVSGLSENMLLLQALLLLPAQEACKCPYAWMPRWTALHTVVVYSYLCKAGNKGVRCQMRLPEAWCTTLLDMMFPV